MLQPFHLAFSLLALLFAALSGTGCSAPQQAGNLQNSAIRNIAGDVDGRSAVDLNFRDDGLRNWRASATNFPEELADEVSFSSSRGTSPLGGEAIEIRGTNHTATVLMYLSRTLDRGDGIVPGKSYQVHARTRLVSGASAECMGTGGSPGGMALSFGAFPENFTQVGTIDNGHACTPDLNDYVELERATSQPLELRADENGRLQVILGVHGGFTGETRLWIESIDLAVVEI